MGSFVAFALVGFYIGVPHTSQVHQIDLSMVGGTQVQQDEAIAHAIVHVKMPTGFCTGTLIREDVIITAAHCFDEGGALGVRVHLPATGGMACSASNVTAIEFPPQTTPRKKSRVPDLALLKLQTKICGARPAQIDRHELMPDDQFSSAGLGRGNRDQNIPERIKIRIVASDQKTFLKLYEEYGLQNRLDAVAFPYMMHEHARDAAHFAFAVPSQAGTSFCRGDSGGPTYRETEGVARLVGVNANFYSHKTKGSPQCENAYLQLITPLSKSLNWIQNKLESWER